MGARDRSGHAAVLITLQGIDMAKVDMVMPQMGESIAEGTILKWLKNVGEKIERDETEIPAPVSGVIAEIVVAEGKTVGVGTVIAKIETEAGAAFAAATPAPVPPKDLPHLTPTPDVSTPAKAPSAAVAVAAAPAAGNGPAQRQGNRFYSPLVRAMAKEEKISLDELESIPGTGANGRVTKNDLVAYLEKKSTTGVSPIPAMPAMPSAPSAPKAEPRPLAAPTPPAGVSQLYEPGRVEVIAMDNMRKRIAEHMVMSKHTSPHVYSVSEADMTNIVRYRESVKSDFEKREGTKLTFTPFFIDAVVRAIKEFPLINSSIDGDKVLVKKYINIGLAVALDNGLIVPVVKNTDSYNLVGLARATNDIAQRARSKQLKPDEVQNGTFSITNMGSFGNLFGIPVINQPQVAIIGIGAIKKRAVVINEAIAIRDMVYLSLSYDHRIIDGAYGGQFLERVVYYLQSFVPEGR
jgi:2-oxoglutarate dehydrogenase E2 component (dihydrolipoamide succinyltransferase)